MIETITNNEEYVALISREPTEDMVKQGNGYKFIPKSILKRELLKIYGGHTKFEMTEKVVTKNGLYGSGLFHYQHPVTLQWLYESGMAAMPHNGNLKLSYPLLKAQVFKNAVREIGIYFGLELNLEFEDAEPEDDIKLKAEPDFIIKQKHKNAVKDGDEKTQSEIEDNYNI